MSFHDCLVQQHADGWRLIVKGESQLLPGDVPIEELVTCIELMIKHAAVKHAGCVLAPDSTHCFFATLQVDSEADARDRAALMYQLEDHLPIDAESMVADFVVVPSLPEQPKTVAAVAVQVDRWWQLADALELAGIPVRSIVPAAMLAARSICRGVNLTDTMQYVLVDQSHCDLLTLRSETVIDWKRARVDAGVLRRHRLLSAVEPDRVVVLGGDAGQQEIIGEVYGQAAEFSTDSIQTHQVVGAELAVAGQSKRWFELRRGQLGPSDPLRPVQTQLRLMTLSAVVCLLAIILGGWWRTRRVENEISRLRQQQRQEFQEAFPDARVPAALLRRVRSEHARVIGSRVAGRQVDVPQSAPDVLRALLSSLPSDVRFRIKSLDIVDGRVDIDLQVRSPVDAGALATSLASAGFDVKPPVTTQKDAKTFNSVLEAVWTGAETSATRSQARAAAAGTLASVVALHGEDRQ